MEPPLRPPSDGGSCACSKQRSTSCVFPAPALPATSVIPCTSMPPPITRSSTAQPSESFRVWRMSSCRACAVTEKGALPAVISRARLWPRGALSWRYVWRWVKEYHPCAPRSNVHGQFFPHYRLPFYPLFLRQHSVCNHPATAESALLLVARRSPSLCSGAGLVSSRCESFAPAVPACAACAPLALHRAHFCAALSENARSILIGLSGRHHQLRCTR